MAVRRHKHGATFSKACVYKADGVTATDITGYTITCHVRKVSGDVLVEELAVTVDDAANGEFTVSATAAETALWDLGEHYMDIRYLSADPSVDISDTIEFTIVRAATRS